jgi:putative MATE family efflux protein
MGADATTYPVIAAYMPIWLISSVILAMPVNANSAMRAAGDTLIPAIVMTSMAVINAILDPILIFGYFGAPAMGVQGAAIATLIATVCCTLLALFFIIYKKDMVATDGLHLDKFKDSFKRLAIIAVPAGIGNIIVPLTSAIILAILAGYGSEAVAAYGVVSRIEAISLILVLALSLGMAPIVGQNWGAGNYGRVHEAISLAILVNFIWSIIVAIVLGLFAHSIASAFSDDPLVLHYSVFFFWVVPFSYGFGNLVFGWGSAFNAMGMPQKAFALIFTKAILITLPAVLIGGWLYGVEGIIASMAFTNLSAGIIIHILSSRICKKHEAALNAV